MCRQADIIIKSYGDKETLWVREGLLRERSGVGSDYLRVRCRPSAKASGCGSKSWRWVRMHGSFYYDYATIPDRAPNYYRSKLGSREALIASVVCPPMSAAAWRGAKRKFYKRLLDAYGSAMNRAYEWYRYGAPHPQPVRRAQELSESWAWLRLIKDISAERGWVRLGLDKSGDFYKLLAEELSARQLAGFKVKTAVGIRNKLKTFDAEQSEAQQWAWLLHGGIGNKNAAIVGTLPVISEQTGALMSLDIHETLFNYYYMNGAQAGLEYKSTLYNKYYLPTITALGYTPVSYSTFTHYTNAYYSKVRSDLYRHGSDYYNKQYLTYVPQKKLAYSGSLWVMDGSGTKLAYKGAQKVHTLYMNRVFDVSSGMILGYSLCDTHYEGESEALIMRALEMAVRVSGGYGAMAFLSDNGGVFQKKRLKDKLRQLFGRVRTIAPGNSQANDAERFIRLMNDIGRQYGNWSGQFNATDKDYKANPDTLGAQLVGKEQAYAQAEALVQQWNAQVGIDGLTRTQRYEQRRNPQLSPLSDKTLRYVFGNESPVDISYMRGFVLVYKNDLKYAFTIPDYEKNIELLTQKTGNKGSVPVLVKWDERQADLYTREGVYLLSCLPTERAPKSYSEGDSESYGHLRGHIARKSAQLTAAARHHSEVSGTMAVLSERLDYGVRVAAGGAVKTADNAQNEVLMNERIKAKEPKNMADSAWEAL